MTGSRWQSHPDRPEGVPCPDTLRLVAVVELAAQSPPEVRACLVAAAYEASRAGEVVLLLNGVTREAADRVLDAIVRDVGLEVHGIRYVTADADRDSIEPMIRAAGIVVASTSAFRDSLARLGVPSVTPPDACRRWTTRPARFAGRPDARMNSGVAGEE